MSKTKAPDPAQALLVQALEDIIEPFAYIERTLPEGYRLDGCAALQQINSREFYARIAKEALAAYRARAIPAPEGGVREALKLMLDTFPVPIMTCAEDIWHQQRAIDAARTALAAPAPQATDAELERRTGEPHVDGWPLVSGLPPAPAEGDDMLEPLIYAAIMYRGMPKTIGDFEQAAANVADMLKRRAQPKLTSVCHMECDGCLDAGKCAVPAPATGDTNGRRNELRPAVHGRVAVGDYTSGALADLLWASPDVMSLNAELGLTMDQLVKLAQALSKAVPNVQPKGTAVPQGPRTEFVLNELRSALSAMTTFFGMDEDEASKPTFDKARQALNYAEIVMRPLEPWERQSLEDFRACVHRWHEKAVAKGYDGVEAMCDTALPYGTRDLRLVAQAPAPGADRPLPAELGEWLTAIGELYIAMGRPPFEATEPTMGVVETLREAAKRVATIEGLQQAVAAGFPVVARWTKNAKDGAPRARVWVQFEDGGPEVEFASGTQAPAVGDGQ